MFGGIGFRYKNYKYEGFDNKFIDNDGNLESVPYNLTTGELFTPTINSESNWIKSKLECQSKKSNCSGIELEMEVGFTVN